MLIAVITLILSFSSATQDIVIDAYRREILADNELGLGTSLFIAASRASIFPAGANNSAIMFPCISCHSHA